MQSPSAVIASQPVVAGLSDLPPLPRAAPQESIFQTLEDTNVMILMTVKTIPLRDYHVGMVWRE